MCVCVCVCVCVCDVVYYGVSGESRGDRGKKGGIYGHRVVERVAKRVVWVKGICDKDGRGNEIK